MMVRWLFDLSIVCSSIFPDPSRLYLLNPHHYPPQSPIRPHHIQVPSP
jgi:hypothetical protein